MPSLFQQQKPPGKSGRHFYDSAVHGTRLLGGQRRTATVSPYNRERYFGKVQNSVEQISGDKNSVRGRTADTTGVQQFIPEYKSFEEHTGRFRKRFRRTYRDRQRTRRGRRSYVRAENGMPLMQTGENNIAKIRGDGQQSRQHRGLHNFKDYAIYGRELFFQDNGRRPVENSEYVHAEFFQVFQKGFQHFAYGISQKDTHFARHGDAVIHRQVHIVHSAGMRFFRRVAFYSRIRAIDEYEAERIPLKIQNRPERQLTEFRSSAFISVFSVFTTLFAVAIFSLSFCDGIAFCPTILIYF